MRQYFCKLELGSRHHHSITIGRQMGAALAELQGHRSALALDDIHIQIYLQILSPYRIIEVRLSEALLIQSLHFFCFQDALSRDVWR